MADQTELAIAQQQLGHASRDRCVLKGNGQSYGVNGRQSTKADLGELRRMEASLVTRIARLTRGGRRVQQIVPL
jgi:hypothetical protein